MRPEQKENGINVEFHKAYMNIPRTKKRQHLKIQKKIITQCGVNVNVFHHWLHGRTEIPFLAKPVISAIMDIPQSELFPEDED